MTYWYPTQVRVEVLTRSLSELEQAAVGATNSQQELVQLFSAALVQAEKTVGFPTRQLARWIWTGSQFRLFGSERADVAIVARGALTFLTTRLARGVITEDDVQDLNWVLDSTINRLGSLLGAESLRSCLSGNELARIDKRLASYKSNTVFDAQILRSRIQKQLINLRALAKDPNLKSITSKIEALFEACGKPGRGSEVARAALLYLADIPDVIPDSAGVLGLLDDIYVIEAAYAAIESQTRCLPLLEALLGKWPFVADLPLVGFEPSPLDRYSQYIACACLYSLFETTGNSMLVLRESAAHCIISSLMAGVAALRKEASAADLDVAKWTTGQAITISDGTKTFKALYGGIIDVGSTPKLRIGVRDNGWITIDKRMLPYVARAQTTHTMLSRGSEILQWLKDSHIDPLVYLTGSSRQRLKQQECVLLVGPRHKLDAYLSCIKPLGSSIAALVGISYVTAHHRFENLSGTATDTPSIYACSDVNTALDLIREPPEHVDTWRIIVDGARTGRALLGSINSADEFASVSLCIFAELHEREAAYDIAKLDASVWYLEDQHVEIPPLQAVRPNPGDDAVVRALTRQTNHWTVSRTPHVIKNEFLEQVSECMKQRTVSNRGSDSEITALDLSLSIFLQRAISRPISNAEVDKSLTILARSIASQASVLRQYDTQASRLYDLFKRFIAADLPSFNKEFELSSIADLVRPGESVAVICRSEQVAESCKASIPPGSRIADFYWVNLERLRQLAPVDRVIVTGWLDKMAMRELNDNGYGVHLDLLFYPFEEKWFTATVNATRKWERRLEAKTDQRLAALAKVFKDSRNAIILDPPLAASSTDESDIENIDDEGSEVDKLEARAIEALSRTVAAGKSGQATAKAQLVLFDQTGEYAYLHPAGKVIVLDRGFLDEELLARGQAERLLFRSVSTLEPGMVLALPTGTDRDLIDARADQFLGDPAKVRNLAGLWKAALKRRLLNGFLVVGNDKFAQQLTAAGHKRAPSTISAWITHTNTVAPSNFRKVIPIIASLTEDSELKTKLEAVLQSIDLIYRARARAADAIVRELFTGKIDIRADELCFDLNGKKIRYLLRHVRRIEGIQEVPTDIIGKVGSLTVHKENERVPEWSA